MRNALISKDEIKTQIREFQDICASLHFRLGIENVLDERLSAADAFVNASPKSNLANPSIIFKTGEFLLLFDCLKAFKDVVAKSVYHSKIIKKDYYDSVMAEFVAAQLCQEARVEFSFAEPDITLKIDGENLSIACKRIRSTRKLDERIHEGREQIRRAGHPGIIFLDVSELMFQSSPLIVGNEALIRETLESRINEFMTKHERRIARILWRSSEQMHSAAGSVIFFNAQMCGTELSIDHDRGVREYQPFFITQLFCLSNPSRHQAVQAFERRILPLDTGRQA